MSEHNHDIGTRILPGVDLALWLRIVVFLIVAAVAGGVAIAAH
jgi:hypothetical protein